MESRDTWAMRFKRRLEEAGYTVQMLDPATAMRRKMAARRRDAKALKAGSATVEEIQRKNSVFSDAKEFRIVDYGALDEEI